MDSAEGDGTAAPLFVDLSSPSSSRTSPSVDDASEVAALAAATAAYAAVAADARATIAGGNGAALGGTVMDIFGTSEVAEAGFEARAAQASADAGLAGSRRMGVGIGEIPKRRFMVHVASWRKTERAAAAAAAILYEEGSWRRLNVRAEDVAGIFCYGLFVLLVVLRLFRGGLLLMERDFCLRARTVRTECVKNGIGRQNSNYIPKSGHKDSTYFTFHHMCLQKRLEIRTTGDFLLYRRTLDLRLRGSLLMAPCGFELFYRFERAEYTSARGCVRQETYPTMVPSAQPAALTNRS